MPSDSRSAEAISIFREFGDSKGGDHPAAFADRLEELLGSTFEFEARRREVATDAGATTWDEALDQSSELRALAATLPPERLAALRTRVEQMLAIWVGRPASYVIVVGSRRDSALAE